MTDPRITRTADLLVNYCTSVQPGDWVLVSGHVGALPLVQETVAAVARAGGNPTVVIDADEVPEALLRNASDTQLAWVSPLDEVMANGLDVRIGIRAATNTRTLTGIDPERQQIYTSARRKYTGTYMERSASGEHRWVVTLFPCPAYAQEADMSVSEYEDFVYAATFADQADPVARWHAVHDRQQELVEWLAGKNDVQVKGPNIDLTLSISGRTFVNSDGKHNMPSGEIFTGPVEDSVNGWVRFSYPAIRDGREVEGVELEFKDGKVVRASAEKNEDYLIRQLDTDAGARFLGEFAVGTNYQIQRFTKSILFDEKIGGTVHMAVGAGYPETGSKNKSSVHWDFICDMREDSEIIVDGELFYRNGQFQI
ncbi:MAG: aminopeptidase [Caldilineaceae bacterium]